MKIFLILFFLVINSLYALELKTGDILLISFNCYECRVIESETNSNYSHSGIIVKDENGEVRVAQSLGKVALYTLEQFIKPITPGSKVAIYRPVELVYSKNIDREMLSIFNQKFKGLPFDIKYEWNNFDRSGKELVYCSEFIAKLVNYFLPEPIQPYPLSYKKNEDYWRKYFGGIIPEGELGNSPASFSTDSRFKFIGFLN